MTIKNQNGHSSPWQLRVQDLAVGYGRTVVLRGISFVVCDGSIAVLQGGNGCGKSTFMRCLNGELRPLFGSVRFTGEDALHGSVLLPQGKSYFDDLTVDDHLRIFHGRRSVDFAYSVSALGFLDGRLASNRSSKARVLSGGERQKVALAMVLAARCSLLLLDEPFANMSDEAMRRSAYLIRRRLRDYGGAVVLAEHRLPRSLERIAKVTNLRSR